MTPEQYFQMFQQISTDLHNISVTTSKNDIWHSQIFGVIIGALITALIPLIVDFIRRNNEKKETQLREKSNKIEQIRYQYKQYHEFLLKLQVQIKAEQKPNIYDYGIGSVRTNIIFHGIDSENDLVKKISEFIDKYNSLGIFDIDPLITQELLRSESVFTSSTLRAND